MTRPFFVLARRLAMAALTAWVATLNVAAHAQDRCNAICDEKNKPCLEAVNYAPLEWRREHAEAEGKKCLMKKLACYQQCVGKK